MSGSFSSSQGARCVLWRYFVFLCVPLLIFACDDGGCGNDNIWNPDGGADGDGDGDSDGDSDGDGDGDGDGCVDNDGDGYGRNCEGGNDCDDADPTRFVNCTVVGLGPGSDNPFDPTDDNSSGVTANDDGGLTLDAYPEIEPAVWIANTYENTVSRLDAYTGREIGRYPSTIPGGNSAPNYTTPCTMAVDLAGNRGNCPSRTAVDFRGDCWVANRAFNVQGSVTKIASHIEDCVDRNGNGSIETSQDSNGNGQIELDSGEFLGDADECVLFTVDVGGVDGVPRALAIAPDYSGASAGGNAWVGMNYERAFAEVDGDTGTILRYPVNIPLNPYGALASKYEGQIWVTNAGWQRNDYPDNSPGICSIDFQTGEVSPRIEVQSTSGCEGTYGITVDAESRVWVGGYPCDGTAFRYDPTTGQWMTVVAEGAGLPRGIVADGEGRIWMAHCQHCGQANCGIITRFNADDGSDIQYYALPSGNDTIGVDLDPEGRVWTVSRATNNAARIDPVTGAIEEFAVGREPYTYSDFTGHSLLLQFPRGYYRDVVEACGGAIWNYLRWDSDTPGDTTIEVRIRVADDEADLGASDWYGPYTESPADLNASPPGPVPHGQFMEIELTLMTHGDIAYPTLHSLEVAYECPIN